MALTASLAAAVAAVCAVVALGGAGVGGVLVAPAAFAVGLVPGLALVAVRPERRVLPAGQDVRLLAIAAGGGLLLFHLTGQSLRSDDIGAVARLAILAVLPLSLLWPAPAVVRFCVLLSAASLVGAGQLLGRAAWPVLGVAAGAAFALVALNRQSSRPPGLEPADSSPTRGRAVREALLLFLGVALIGLLVSTLLPSPRNQGNQSLGEQEQAGRRAGPGPSSPYLNPSDHLDTTGYGSGGGDRVLLRIEAAVSSRWRTQTFDRWDGRSWLRSEGIDPWAPAQPGAFVEVPPGVGDEDEVEFEMLYQRVKVVAASAGLFAAAPRVVNLRSAAERVQLDGAGTARAAPPLGRGATYTAVSVRIRPTRAQLRDNDLSHTGVPADLARLYLQLPEVSGRVRHLATGLAGSGTTTYGKIRAVEGWLASNTEVAPGPPHLPAGADPLDHFLFTTRKGSAEQAASSMAVMLRSLGIPARVAVGFRPGDRYLLGGEFVVRARHAHAWVEAWFPALGWIGFDPSGGTEGVQDDGDSLGDRLGRLLADFWWVLALLLAVAVRWLTWRAARRWQRQRARPWATRSYERLVRAGASAGRPRRPAETPAEYCGALAELRGDERLRRVGQVLTAAAYSPRDPPEADKAWTNRVVRHAASRRRRRPPRRPEAASEGIPAR